MLARARPKLVARGRCAAAHAALPPRARPNMDAHWPTHEAVGDANLRTLSVGQIIQLERRGYYRCDRPYLGPDRPLVLITIPDGKAKAMSTLSSALSHR